MKTEHTKKVAMKSIFEEMGGTYRWQGDYRIPNIELPEQEEYQLSKYGHIPVSTPSYQSWQV
ncbi:TnpV protein [Holdemanella biformis]|nr:TnpV protein [Holdemanella biformis]